MLCACYMRSPVKEDGKSTEKQQTHLFYYKKGWTVHGVHPQSLDLTFKVLSSLGAACSNGISREGRE